MRENSNSKSQNSWSKRSKYCLPSRCNYLPFKRKFLGTDQDQSLPVLSSSQHKIILSENFVWNNKYNCFSAIKLPVIVQTGRFTQILKGTQRRKVMNFDFWNQSASRIKLCNNSGMSTRSAYFILLSTQPKLFPLLYISSKTIRYIHMKRAYESPTHDGTRRENSWKPGKRWNYK